MTLSAQAGGPRSGGRDGRVRAQTLRRLISPSGGDFSVLDLRQLLAIAHGQLQSKQPRLPALETAPCVRRIARDTETGSHAPRQGKGSAARRADAGT